MCIIYDQSEEMIQAIQLYMDIIAAMDYHTTKQHQDIVPSQQDQCTIENLILEVLKDLKRDKMKPHLSHYLYLQKGANPCPSL